LPWLATGTILGAMAPEACSVAWGWTLAPLGLLLCIGLPCSVIAAATTLRWPWASRGLALLAAATVGMALASTERYATTPGPRLMAVRGTVSSVLWQRETQGFLVHVEEVLVPDRLAPPARLVVRAPPLPAVACGDQVVVRGLWERDVRGETLRAVALERQERREEGSRGWAWQALARLGARRELGESLLIGQGSPPEKDDFRRSGLLHILAVSGSHLAIAAALGVWLLRLAGLSWGLRQVALGALLISYTWLTGGTPATQRALAMGLAMLVMGMLARQPHRLAAVSLAALALVAMAPANARDLGFLLSLSAVLGLVTLGMDLVTLRERWLPLAAWPLDRAGWRACLFTGRTCLDGLALGIGASLATAPLIAWTFEKANPWAAISTLAATPPATAALWLGLPLMGLAGTWPDGPWDGLYAGLEGSLDALATTVRWSAELPGAVLVVDAPRWWTVLLWPLLFVPLRSGMALLGRIGLFTGLVLAW
jgi:ComEC/Rec2-related protein